MKTLKEIIINNNLYESILDDEDVFLDDMEKALLLGAEWKCIMCTVSKPDTIFDINKLKKTYKKLSVHFETTPLYNFSGKSIDIDFKEQERLKVIINMVNNLYLNRQRGDIGDKLKKIPEFKDVLNDGCVARFGYWMNKDRFTIKLSDKTGSYYINFWYERIV